MPETTHTEHAEPGHGSTSTTSPILLVLAWLVVAIPLIWGTYQTLVKAAALFTG